MNGIPESPPASSGANDRATLMEREEGWTAALVAADVATIKSYMSPEFSITTAGWLDGPADGEMWLRHALDRFALHEFAFDEVVVRIHGEVGIVQSRCRQAGVQIASGEPWAMVFRYTDVWVRDGGIWRIEFRHASNRT